MEIIKITLKDLFILRSNVFQYERSYFMRLFKENIFKINFPRLN